MTLRDLMTILLSIGIIALLVAALRIAWYVPEFIKLFAQ